jgi:hypothetical protein
VRRYGQGAKGRIFFKNNSSLQTATMLHLALLEAEFLFLPDTPVKQAGEQ